MIREPAPGLLKLIAEDYRTHGRDWLVPGFLAMATYRFGVWRMGIRSRWIRGPISVIYRVMYRRCAFVYGIEIPFTAQIGRRVKIEHQHGIVIHGASVIGDDCILRQGVTLGIRDEQQVSDAPRLGNGVSVGAGAKILGKVTVGDRVKIGANAVVIRDVPADCIAVGVPARVIHATDGRSSEAQESREFREFAR